MMKAIGCAVLAALLAGTGAAAQPKDVAARPVCTQTTRACLERTAQTYIDGLVSHDGSKIPLATNVRRTENALTNARGPYEVRESFARTTMIESAKDVRFFTDVAKGEVVVFFLLNIDLKATEGGGDAHTKAGDTEYQVAITKPAGTYTVHEAERFKIKNGYINEIEIIAHVEDGKGMGNGWREERLKLKAPAK